MTAVAQSTATEGARRRISPESLREFLETGRNLVQEGKLPVSHLQEFHDIEEDFRDKTQEEWDLLDHFIAGLPKDSCDLATIAESGDRLVQEKVQEFLQLLAPNIPAVDLPIDERISLGESLCLKGPEPTRLWRKVRKLHDLNASMASRLSNEVIALTEEFLADIDLHPSENEDTGERLKSAIAILYGEMDGLVHLARE